MNTLVDTSRKDKMILFPPEAEWNAPGMCVICESTPDRKTIPIISTQRILNIGYNHPLAGNKYLCGDCIRTAMTVLNWAQPEEVVILQEKVEDLKSQLENVSNEKDRLADFQYAIKTLDTLGFKFKEKETEVIEEKETEVIKEKETEEKEVEEKECLEEDLPIEKENSTKLLSLSKRKRLSHYVPN